MLIRKPNKRVVTLQRLPVSGGRKSDSEQQPASYTMTITIEGARDRALSPREVSLIQQSLIFTRCVHGLIMKPVRGNTRSAGAVEARVQKVSARTLSRTLPQGPGQG